MRLTTIFGRRKGMYGPEEQRRSLRTGGSESGIREHGDYWDTRVKGGEGAL